MIKQSMDVIWNAVEHLNPGQTPVITFDQPLYAMAKQIQWKWPEEYGEDKIVIMFGGLHIEMAALLVTGASTGAGRYYNPTLSYGQHILLVQVEHTK